MVGQISYMQLFILKNLKYFGIFFLAISIIAITSTITYSSSFDKLPVKGMVTMIDLGAKRCIPCKMMAPILKKMENLYKGTAIIAFIDVWKNKNQAQRFRIRGIPTQIFFDKKGKEVYRHAGFMSEKDIKTQLTKMGVSPLSKKKNL